MQRQINEDAAIFRVSLSLYHRSVYRAVVSLLKLGSLSVLQNIFHYSYFMIITARS